jgi:hypothetical protein
MPDSVLMRKTLIKGSIKNNIKWEIRLLCGAEENAVEKTNATATLCGARKPDFKAP